ncbi:MAG: hypothetical protein Q9218_003863 [Villophora microphyllina]
MARELEPPLFQQLEHISRYGSVSSSPLRVWNNNIQTTPTFNRSKFLSADDASLRPSSVRSSRHSSRKRSLEIATPIPKHYRPPPAFTQELDPLTDITFDSPSNDQDEDDGDSDKENQLPVEKVPRLSFDVAKEDVLSIDESSVPPRIAEARPLPDIPARPRASKSLKRWISHLRPQTSKQKKTLTMRTQRWPLDESPQEQRPESKRSGHRKTGSDSSAGLVGTLKAVVMERSTGTPTPGKSRRSSLFSRSNRGSRASETETGLSSDQPQGLQSRLDSVALTRATRRQKVLEELVDSEKSYVSDLKILIHAYFTFLAWAPNVSQRTSMQINHNVTEILELHQDLLCQMQQVMKGSVTQLAGLQQDKAHQSKQHNRRSNDAHRIASAVAGLVHTARTSFESARPGHPRTHPTPADTHKVLEIAKIFGRTMNRFFVYEDYGAKYDVMMRDSAQTLKSITNWHAFERSIEALANSLASSGASDEPAKKGLSFGDLLVKPVQRICKYPLLFEKLFGSTWESDSAEAHAALKKVLGQLRKAAENTNSAIDDPEAQARIQRSWRLQDLLILPDVVNLPPSLRLLGDPGLCGILYVAYESGQEICGEYMLCVLFQSYLLLAAQQSEADRYDVAALINLSDTQVRKPDDGRGLQCHTASFSWKLVFESNQALYELIFCACSSEEEETWIHTIAQHAEKATKVSQDGPIAPIYGFLAPNINSLGPVFGMFGSVTRRLSVQRAATVHSPVNGPQVIIRNTTTGKHNKRGLDNAFDSIGRSKSVMTATHVPILAPKRADRTRMESALADVWSRDHLPFPGMSTHRDNAIRASASSMMRMISRASISSTFSKRSASTTSFSSLKPVASAGDLQKIGEGDEEHDFHLDAYESLYSTPKRIDQRVEEKVEGSGKLMRAGTVKGVKLSDATNQVREREVLPRFEGRTVRIESTDKGSPRIVRSRRSVPGGLLKGFSTEGLKAWRA